jgi:hypothetical protein
MSDMRGMKEPEELATAAERYREWRQLDPAVDRALRTLAALARIAGEPELAGIVDNRFENLLGDVAFLEQQLQEARHDIEVEREEARLAEELAEAETDRAERAEHLVEALSDGWSPVDVALLEEAADPLGVVRRIRGVR